MVGRIAYKCIACLELGLEGLGELIDLRLQLLRLGDPLSELVAQQRGVACARRRHLVHPPRRLAVGELLHLVGVIVR